MSRSLNKAMLIGHVGAAPEVRTTRTGSRVASFSLATTRRWTAADGIGHEKTDWHRVIARDQLAELAERHIRKGERLFVEGHVEYRDWEDRNGRPRHATEIIAEDLVLMDGGAPADHPAPTLDWRTALRNDASPDAGTGRGGTRARWGDDELPF